ncbi:type I restriction endonuclease subunit R [Runella sp.]|uniref:EcoAI/FtnUII family type I restriction enzme subunit R n=1 Tax=Runella sp. TaxID=1960881 RepID=UPI00263216E6|nr:type I restriction endonuclease subunit R [Runella sp.]
MNEAETRAELIDPKLRACGWGVVEGSKVLRERQAQITNGKINVGGVRSRPMKADYILVYKGIKLAVVEAKSDELGVGEGVAQAKQYAEKLKLETTYATNGKEIYQICLKTGVEGLVANYLTPDELWNKTFAEQNDWREKFASVPFETIGGTKPPRFYQEIAVNKVLEAVVNKKERILLTLATGTGKTTIAFQIAWKLFQTRWNLKWDGSRRPRILFLADRNVLSDQAYGEFSRYAAFKEDALLRISPKAIRDINDDGKKVVVNTFLTNPQKNKVRVPTNGNIFFTIFQTFMTGENEPNFGEYPADYFDFIIIDECHRGGANDEGNWRGILEYFAPAVQLGLTATPKRPKRAIDTAGNVDTYKYFGEPVYIYSLKEGINDGFLTPFKVKRIQTTLDDYIYTSDDQVIEGEVEQGKRYAEPDFNKIIEIKEREAKRVQIYMDEANQNEKAIIFCATQDHAAAVRDLVNQYKKSKTPNYCVRVTANDGEIGEQFLREFQDNEKAIPTILTTSQKLSTGVDARNIRNIVLMRPVNSMIEFKQIVGRGTRLFDGKEFFTIYDFVDAYHHFADPAWDGEPVAPEPPGGVGEPKEPYKTPEKKADNSEGSEGGQGEGETPKRLKIKLRDGKEREIQHMIATSFWSADGRPISAQEFMDNLFGKMPDLFQNEEELRTLWSNPLTRKTLLEKVEEAGFPKSDLLVLQQLVDMEKSDLFDVLEYVFYNENKTVTRQERVAAAQATIFALLNDKQKEFIEFVLSKYIETGVEELDQEKLPVLLTNKYQSLEDAKKILGEVSKIRQLFIEFQKHLYEQKAA